jgi:hypothetical protein
MAYSILLGPNDSVASFPPQQLAIKTAKPAIVLSE